MRKFQPPYGKAIDLDDPSIYHFLPNTEKELDNMMFSEIGKALVYMDYFRPYPKKKRKPDMQALDSSGKLYDINNCEYDQRARVNELIKNFAENRKHNYGNLMWFKEQIFLFQWETENMC